MATARGVTQRYDNFDPIFSRQMPGISMDSRRYRGGQLPDYHESQLRCAFLDRHSLGDVCRDYPSRPNRRSKTRPLLAELLLTAHKDIVRAGQTHPINLAGQMKRIVTDPGSRQQCLRKRGSCKTIRRKECSEVPGIAKANPNR